jgi:hypothetical protein
LERKDPTLDYRLPEASRPRVKAGDVILASLVLVVALIFAFLAILLVAFAIFAPRHLQGLGIAQLVVLTLVMAWLSLFAIRAAIAILRRRPRKTIY